MLCLFSQWGLSGRKTLFGASDSYLTEISVMSPRKLTSFIIQKTYFLDQCIQKKCFFN